MTFNGDMNINVKCKLVRHDLKNDTCKAKCREFNSLYIKYESKYYGNGKKSLDHFQDYNVYEK